MSHSAEDVLLIVNKVKNKKCEGSLYMMSQRMAWMPATKDTFTVSHNYADIKVQKISPDTKDKVQLQVVMHDGGANTFHFTNPAGRAAQLADREGVKELLQQLLPRFRRKVNSELEQKNRMLQEDPELFQLYKDLVVSGVITTEEFWANRTKKLCSSLASQQEVGVSAAFLAEVKPQSDGCNGLKYNLTKDIIESIFRTYPIVRQKHAENVPDKVSEHEFWTKFFQSHYFHRDRVSFSNKDMFADCAKHDEKDILEELKKPLNDPLMDLTSITDNTAGDGYGTEISDTSIAAINPSNLSLMRRFNQHSSMVLKACQRRSVNNEAFPANGQLVESNGQQNNTPQPDDKPPPNKKAKIREKIEYDDLDSSDTGPTGPVLRLTHMDRYLHGPTPAMPTQYNTSEDSLQACQALTSEVLVWDPRLSQVLPTHSAVSVLWELSPGGALMQAHTQQQIHQLVPEEVQNELHHHYSALCELLRHFWSCFPVTSKFLEEKVVRMKVNLERFQSVKLNPLKDKLQSYHYSLNLVGHMEDLIAAVNNKFSIWQSKHQHRKS